jgi:hypothetical protein
MPSGTRISEPVSTGMAVSRPNSVAFRFSIFLIGMPMTPNIIQTMKQTVKARVLTMSTDQACRLRRESCAAGSDADAMLSPCDGMDGRAALGFSIRRGRHGRRGRRTMAPLPKN